ncbi:MAG TPA: ABC transporter ATP-binding protein [Acidobacteriota bacterium]|nr:ABC transporter ATP-binding protein [Acidobacteriota bacterium]
MTDTADSTRRIPLLKIQGLCKDFSSGSLWGESIRVIDDVDMEVQPGEIRGVVGESGSGKTTLARCSLRLIEPTSGSVRFDGEDLASLGPAALRARRKEFQMIFQDTFGSLNPGMTVGRVLSEPLEIHNIGSKESRDRRVRELLDSVSLSTSLIHRKTPELSGGQQQRLGIARGLALNPKLLIADEPVSALDTSVAAQILNLLGDLKKQNSLTLILISHSLHVVHYLCTRISVIYKGRLIEEAPAPSFFKEPKHPYSRILLDSMPTLEPRENTISSAVEKTVQSSTGALPGCAFYAHCPHRLPVCRENIPSLSGNGSQERVACFLYPQKSN